MSQIIYIISCVDYHHKLTYFSNCNRLFALYLAINLARNRQTLKQDFGSGHGKGKPLCMETYKNFFHSYRMPNEDMDRLLPQSRRSNHIVVASCNQFYVLRLGDDPLPDPFKKDSSVQLNSNIIFEQLLRIYRVSREHARRELIDESAKIPKIGLFTTENRKIWAKLHKKLTHCNGSNLNNHEPTCNSTSSRAVANIESLRLIEDCLFVMCIDSLVGCSDSTKGNKNNNNNLSDVEAANIILTGAGSSLFTGNRWFDKFLQIIVGRNGICGINIEHSASEGITVLRFIEEFLEFIKQNPIKPNQSQDLPLTNNQQAVNNNNNLEVKRVRNIISNHTNSITSPSYVEPKSPNEILEETDKITPLVWVLDDELRKGLDEAERNINKLIDNFSLHILNFNHFGRNFIKNQNLSPDAFIQLALQYSFFKIHGHLVSTYESASLRQFRFGRVDNIRANTCEAHDWIQTMLTYLDRDKYPDDDVRRSKLKHLCETNFIKAITKQVEILRYTIIGGGPDNHLIALKQLAHIRYDDELPELFVDQSYREYLNFRLSTSQLPNDSGITVGYGAVVPDGYGCSYNPCDDMIVFCVSTFHDCPTTSSRKFATTLEQCLLEMQQLCLGRV